MLTHDGLKRDVARRITRLQNMMRERDVGALINEMEPATVPFHELNDVAARIQASEYRCKSCMAVSLTCFSTSASK